jgi:hypothetical protein
MRVDEAGAGEATLPSGGYARALADDAFRSRYRAAYGGEGDPLDALWWLEHPEERAPSGHPAPWAAARASRRRVYAPDCTDADLVAARAAERRAVGVRDAARAALERAQQAEPPRSPARVTPVARTRRSGIPGRLLPLLGAGAAAAVLAAGVASLPTPHVDRPGLARSLQAVFPGATPRPADVRLAVSGAGGETVTRSVDGRAALRITTVLCRGAGRIQVRLSDQTGNGTGMLCVGGRARLTRVLDAMPKDPFVATVVVTGRVAWSVTIADEEPRYDEETWPRCGGVEC